MPTSVCTLHVASESLLRDIRRLGMERFSAGAFLMRDLAAVSHRFEVGIKQAGH